MAAMSGYDGEDRAPGAVAEDGDRGGDRGHDVESASAVVIGAGVQWCWFCRAALVGDENRDVLWAERGQVNQEQAAGVPAGVPSG